MRFAHADFFREVLRFDLAGGEEIGEGDYDRYQKISSSSSR